MKGYPLLGRDTGTGTGTREAPTAVQSRFELFVLVLQPLYQALLLGARPLLCQPFDCPSFLSPLLLLGRGGG